MSLWLSLRAGQFPCPSEVGSVYFKIERVVAIFSGGANISTEYALVYVYGYGVDPINPGEVIDGMYMSKKAFNRVLASIQAA